MIVILILNFSGEEIIGDLQSTLAKVVAISFKDTKPEMDD